MKKSNVKRFSFSTKHRLKGWTIQSLVLKAVKAHPRGCTNAEIKTYIWNKHRISLTFIQISGAVAHLRVNGKLQPFERKRKEAVRKTKRPVGRPPKISGQKSNVVLFKKSA